MSADINFKFMDKNSLEKKVDDIYEVVIFIKDNAVTKSEFKEAIGGLNTRVGALTGRVDEIEKSMATKKDLAGLETRLVTKSYLDDKLANLGAEIGARINRLMERERAFKKEVVELLKRHSLADAAEIEKLESLI